MSELLLDTSIRSMVVAVAVGVILKLARVHAGALRHAAWTAVLFAMLLMPVMPSLVPAVTVPVTMPVIVDVQPPVAVPTAVVSQPVPEEREFPWPAIGLTAYALVAVLLFGRLAYGWHAARRIALAALPLDLPGVYESSRVTVPLTFGVINPRILLPVSWKDWPAIKLRAVLAHESAHVARRDSLVSLVAHLNRCLFWFHPLAWWLERKIAATAEQACDDAAVETIGDNRAYLEVLTDLMQTVHRHGGRLSMGMDGLGTMGERVDRILRGEVGSSSRSRKIIVAVAGSAAVLFVAACQLRKMPDSAAVQKAEAYDRLQRESVAKNRAEQSLWNTAAAMTPEQAESLEAAVRRNPEDLEARKKLLIYYSRNGMGKAPPGYLRHTLWLIEHHPERVVLQPPDNLEGYAQAKQLWLAKADRDGLTVPVYLNASNFFRVRDKPLAERMLLRAIAIDPRYVSHLPQLYYAALIGSNAAMPLGVVRSVSAQEAESAYATEVRKKLDSSNDTGLLMDVGRHLILEQVPMDTGFDRRALGTQYIEHALRLQPDLPGAQRLLDVARRGLPIPPLPGQYPLLPGQSQAERVKQLAQLAVMTYMRGDMFAYYQHDLAKAKVEWEQARKVSEEVLRYPDHAAAYFSANMTLGMVTMRNGDQKQAAKYIRAAAKAPPSKETLYGFHPFADKLSTALLKAGERDAVAEFLEAYGRMSIPNRQRWSEAAVLIRAGKTPYWAQN